MKQMNEFKQASEKKFKSIPSENSELFKYQTIFSDFSDFDVGKEESLKIVSKPDNVEVVPMKEADVGRLIEKFDIDDKFVQMNNAFFNSGFFVKVRSNVDASDVLRISSMPNGNSVSKVIIAAEPGSRIDVVKESTSPDEKSRITSEDVLVVAGEGSSVKFSELQNYNALSTFFSNKISSVGKDASVSWNTGIMGGGMCRTRTYNFLEGEGAYGEDMQLTFGDGKQRFDSFSNLLHIGRSTSGKTLAKGAFKDSSDSVFKGMIKIGEKAKNASSYLACHGMLLSNTAKANAVPGLEIETNDVKATHAASVSPIDEDKIFYMVSRGIDKEDAKRIITMGFFDPLIGSVSSKEIRAKIRYLVESKWNGEKVSEFDSSRLEEYMTEDAIKSGDMFEGHYKYR